MRAYTCYGLRLHSEIDLPELTELDADGAASPDIQVVCGLVAGPATGATQLTDGLWRDEMSCGLAVTDVADYVAHEGAQIVVDAAPNAEPRAVRLFLLGTMMGAIMMQRGHLVLHGNAVRIGDSCVVVLGHSGTGKSTLAAEFLRRGFDVLTDDVVPVDSQGRALTGHPHIKLWADALDGLGLQSAGLVHVRGAVPKFQLPISRPELGPLPVRRIYVLDEHGQDTCEIVRVSGVDSFDVLREHTYRKQLIFDQATGREHLGQCAALGRRARIVRLLRPAVTRTAALTADAILADIASDSATIDIAKEYS